MSPLHVVFLSVATWFALVQKVDWTTTAAAIAVTATAWAWFQRTLGPNQALRARGLRAACLEIPKFYLAFVVPNVTRAAAQLFWPPGGSNRTRPCLIAVQLPEASEAGMSIFAHGVTLSPTEQVVAVDVRRRQLFVHVMDVSDPEAHRRMLGEAFRRYLREV